MWLGGYRGISEKHRGSQLKRNLLSVVLLLILTGVLGTALRELIAKQVYQASVRRVLEKTTHKGAYLTDLRFQQTARPQSSSQCTEPPLRSLRKKLRAWNRVCQCLKGQAPLS
jgi:hypothetical protein